VDAQGHWVDVKYLYAPDDPEAVIEQMADSATRIVALTVTEGGYNFHPVTGKFDTETRRYRQTWLRAPYRPQPSA
jgi:mannitol 2-dehydrogenase